VPISGNGDLPCPNSIYRWQQHQQHDFNSLGRASRKGAVGTLKYSPTTPGDVVTKVSPLKA
jgi:hypothetical protein